jgi:hypothetical protein
MVFVMRYDFWLRILLVDDCEGNFKMLTLKWCRWKWSWPILLAVRICLWTWMLNLDVRGFWPSVIIHFNSVVLTFCGQLWQIRIISHGWQVRFIVSRGVAHVSAFDEVRLIVSMLCGMRPSFSHVMLLYVSKQKISGIKCKLQCLLYFLGLFYNFIVVPVTQ